MIFLSINYYFIKILLGQTVNGEHNTNKAHHKFWVPSLRNLLAEAGIDVLGHHPFVETDREGTTRKHHGFGQVLPIIGVNHEALHSWAIKNPTGMDSRWEKGKSGAIADSARMCRKALRLVHPTSVEGQPCQTTA